MASTVAKPTRQQKIAEAGFSAYSAIAALNHRYQLFNPNVTKVVDLGFAPGHWLTFARDALVLVHNVPIEEIHSTCTLIGLDILFAQPPMGTISTQGNIYSQAAHTAIEGLLKDAAFRRLRGILAPDSYVAKESAESELEEQVSSLTRAFGDLSVDGSLDQLMGPKMYQADVVMADLGAPFLQDLGFFNNTHTKPYIRTGRRLHTPKSTIDMAEAALLLCCTALGKNGTFVVRLAGVELEDVELELLELRLRIVFNTVSRWAPSGARLLGLGELYFVGEGKRAYKADKYEVFGVERPEPSERQGGTTSI